jgi:hypothetical protein
MVSGTSRKPVFVHEYDRFRLGRWEHVFPLPFATVSTGFRLLMRGGTGLLSIRRWRHFFLATRGFGRVFQRCIEAFLGIVRSGLFGHFPKRKRKHQTEG